MDNTYIKTTHVSCDLCKSDDSKLIFKMHDLRYWITDQEYSIVKCRDCGHRFLNPRPVIDDLQKCYPPEYYNFREQNMNKQKIRYIRQSSYFKNLTPGRFLDIGCAKGAFCETMMELGWECYGMDLFDQPINELPKNLNFNAGDLEEIAYPDNYFDGISAWGVFEHLLSPKRYFLEVARILKPGGLFVILTTNANSLSSRFAFKEDVPRHLHFFTPRSIKKYAEIANLRIVKIEFTNNIYSRPATGKDCFRINFLRWAGVPWNKINHRQSKLHLKVISDFGTLMGQLLIHSRIEEILGISGIMVIQFIKGS